MKKVKHRLAGLFLALSLGFVCAPARAVEPFEQGGPISAIGSSRFVVEDQEYRIAPGAKLQSFDASRRRLSDFREGDVIIFEGKRVNGVYFVDKIVYHAPKPS
jgi:hypothetical protein